MGAGETGERLFLGFSGQEKHGGEFPLRIIGHRHPDGHALIGQRLQRLPCGGAE